MDDLLLPYILFVLLLVILLLLSSYWRSQDPDGYHDLSLGIS